ncbi:UNVERIFIED_CONTAM: hypothetical protein FKN15_055051 [Acipenser sinensis]
MNSREIWDWLLDSEGNLKEALPMVIDLLWARDGEQWEACKKQHRPASLLDIAAMVLNYLAADMGGASPSLVPSGGATPTPTPQTVGTSTPEPRGETHQSPATEREQHQSPENEGKQHQSPATKGKPHQSPATEGEPHQSLVFEGDYPLLPPLPPMGDYLLLLPPPPGGDYLLLLPLLPEGDHLLLPHPPPKELKLPPEGQRQPSSPEGQLLQ